MAVDTSQEEVQECMGGSEAKCRVLGGMLATPREGEKRGGG